MCRTQYVLVVAVLYMGLAHSWDIAVSLGDELVFYTNGSKTDTVRFKSRNLTALAYDEVHNILLYVDKQSDNDTICGYNLHSTENKCFLKRVGSNIHSIAFDPATDILFFTDTVTRSIHWISLKPGSNKKVYENLLITMDDRTPTDIAVDSCRGYIYWTNTKILNLKSWYMERARFNGSEKKVVITWLPIFSFAVDPQTREIHYFDGCEECDYEFLARADLNGREDGIRRYVHSYLSTPQEMTVSKDYLYWMNSSESYRTVWHLPKNAMNGEEPKEISKFYNKRPLSIAANYKIKDQIQGLQDCEALLSLIQKQQTTETEQTTEYTKIAEVYCVHGIKISDTSVCECTPGYIGLRCDVSVCENYCLQGDCSFNDEGLPKCSWHILLSMRMSGPQSATLSQSKCNAGYSGERCELYACHDYCLNNGDCFLNEKSEPVCQCKGDYVGDRCELSDCLNYCIRGNCIFNDERRPKCRCNAGFSGERCEVYACHGYCLNNGTCSLNEEDEPFCQCVDNHEGTRCEAANDTFTNTPTVGLVNRNLTLADLLSSWRKPTLTLEWGRYSI